MDQRERDASALPTPRNDGNLLLGSIGTEINDLVFTVESAIRVGEGDAIKGGEDEMRGIVDEVFG